MRLKTRLSRREVVEDAAKATYKIARAMARGPSPQRLRLNTRPR